MIKINREKKYTLIVFLLFFCLLGKTQNWTLKLSSTVELRTWRLSSVAEKAEKELSGAEIKLFKGNSLIGQTNSNPNGDFVIDVPAGGDFILTISYAGCNTKKFNVSTTGVDENVGKDNYMPTVNITGFIMSKPLKGVDYLGLSEPLVRVEYKTKGQNFDKDDDVTNKGLNILSKIYDSETALIQKFCATNKAGDDAMKNHNCPMAIEYYAKAINMLPGEEYPVDQIKKAEQCVKNKKDADDAKARENLIKANNAKIANEKAIAEKQAKDKAAFNKVADDKVAKEKTTNNKDSKNSNTPEKVNSDKLITSENETGNNGSNIKKGRSNHSLAQPIGKNAHKETVKKADDYFKMKRYSEAKTAYQEAIKIKSDDSYSKNKLAEIAKLTSTK
ncbi:MAG: hypothetical protein Q7W45_06815 [Bacteroidota bacterium]|nr:hypothetical protein [Bacteroidota bacterium]MDP3146541.1 hypothetical protein [Bacteroidota bacterium]